MGRIGLAARIGATMVLVVAGALPWLAPVHGDLPLAWDTGPRPGTLAVVALPDAASTPAPLPPGTLIDGRRMSVRDRLVAGNPSLAPGTTLVLPLVGPSGPDAGGRDRIEVQASPRAGAGIGYPWREWPFLLLSLLVWKGRDRIAWGVALLLAGVGMLAPVLWAPLPGPWNIPQRLFVEYVVRLMAAAGAWMVLLGLLAGKAPRLSRAINFAHLVLFSVYFVDRLARDLPWILHGQVMGGEPFRPSLPVVLAFLANFMVLAILTSRRIDAASRLRARWASCCTWSRFWMRCCSAARRCGPCPTH